MASLFLPFLLRHSMASNRSLSRLWNSLPSVAATNSPLQIESPSPSVREMVMWLCLSRLSASHVRQDSRLQFCSRAMVSQRFGCRWRKSISVRACIEPQSQQCVGWPGRVVSFMTFELSGLGCPDELLAVRNFLLGKPSDRLRRFGLCRFACQRREA